MEYIFKERLEKLESKLEKLEEERAAEIELLEETEKEVTHSLILEKEQAVIERKWHILALEKTIQTVKGLIVKYKRLAEKEENILKCDNELKPVMIEIGKVSKSLSRSSNVSKSKKRILQGNLNALNNKLKRITKKIDTERNSIVFFINCLDKRVNKKDNIKSTNKTKQKRNKQKESSALPNMDKKKRGRPIGWNKKEKGDVK